MYLTSMNAFLCLFLLSQSQKGFLLFPRFSSVSLPTKIIEQLQHGATESVCVCGGEAI